MNEMVTTAAASTLALLLLYPAALAFLLQTISERYTAAILRPLLREAALPWVGALAGIAVVTFALIGIPLWLPLKAGLAGVLLIGDIFLAGFGCYRAWVLVSERDHIAQSVKNLPRDRQPGAVREIVWNSITRSDVEMARIGLRLFPRGSSYRVELLTWVLGHRPLANREWLSLELLDAMVDVGLTEAEAKAIRDPLIALLDQVLDQENMPVAYGIVHRTMRALAEAEVFSEAHGQLLLDVARGIWLVGDYMGETPRTTRIPEQLDYLKSVYANRRRDIFYGLVQRKERAGMTNFVAFLCLALDDTGETGSAFSLLWDVAEDAHQAGILEPRAIQEIGNVVGHLRMREAKDGEVGEIAAESWDHLALQLTRDLIDMDVADGDILHLLANYGYFARGRNLAVKTRPNGRSPASERRLQRILRSRS